MLSKFLFLMTCFVIPLVSSARLSRSNFHEKESEFVASLKRLKSLDMDELKDEMYKAERNRERAASSAESVLQGDSVKAHMDASRDKFAADFYCDMVQHEIAKRSLSQDK